MGMGMGIAVHATFFVGNLYPLLEMATLTLSRASCTAASGNPTIEKPGRPELTSTSTSTGNASIPNRLRLLARHTDISHNTHKPSP